MDRYHLQLHQDKLVRLAATWDRCLPDLGFDSAIAAPPPWGPPQAVLSRCRVDAHLAARGEDRHYGQELDNEGDDGESEGEDEEESGGEDEGFGTLDALERADVYRNYEDD